MMGVLQDFLFVISQTYSGCLIKIAKYYSNKRKIMKMEVKSSLSPVVSPKYFFTLCTCCEDFFFFIANTIFRCQMEIKI